LLEQGLDCRQRRVTDHQQLRVVRPYPAFVEGGEAQRS
jgi:hypothetical protein